MNPRIKKVISDLTEQPARAFLVFLAIALGAAALTVALGARSVLLREIPASFATAEPPAAVFWLEDVDNQVLQGVRALPGVVDADARRVVRARVEVAPGDWRTLRLFGVRDFSDLRVSAFETLEGQWPPERGAILVERSGLTVLGAGTGDTITVRTPGGVSTPLPIRGVVHDPALAPGWQDNAAYAYVSRETLADLGLGDHLDELRITVDGDRSVAARVADDVASWLTKSGHAVSRVEVSPRRHPHADHMTTMLLLLSVFSALALVLSGTLAASITAALLARQVRQIGVMKTIGARSSDIAAIYLAMIAVLAAPAIAIGLGAGLLGARSFSSFAAQQLNLDIASLAVGPSTLLTIVCIGLTAPLVAAAIPIARAVRMPVQKALQDPGITALGTRGRAKTRLSSLLGGFMRPTVLAVRNSFRRPARLGLTLFALGLGGAALMTASNVHVSLIAAVDRSLDHRGDDIDVRLLRPVDAADILADIHVLPGVAHAEAWGGALVALSTEPSAKTSRGRYGLLAPPPDTALLNVPLVEGRWPEAMQIGDLVVNRNLQAIEPALVIGAEVQLALGPRSVSGRIVGIIEEVAEPSLYTNPHTFDVLMGAYGLAGVIRVVADPGSADRLAAEIEEVIVDAGSMPALLFTRGVLRQAMVDHFAILLALLSMAAIAAIIVGGLGLAASMGLNVLERTREIGVIRAMGARPAAVRTLILTEGYAIALASVVCAGVLSVPLSMVVTTIVGTHGLHLTLPLVFSPRGVLVWIVLVAVLTLIACIGPARRAMRTPVCEAIAYE